MKIKIKGDDYGFKLWAPLWLIKCNFVGRLIAKNSGGWINEKAVKKLIKLCYAELKKHKGLVLVDIVSSDGSIVNIII